VLHFTIVKPFSLASAALSAGTFTHPIGARDEVGLGGGFWGSLVVYWGSVVAFWGLMVVY